MVRRDLSAGYAQGAASHCRHEGGRGLSYGALERINNLFSAVRLWTAFLFAFFATKSPKESLLGEYEMRQRSNLPGRHQPSTFDVLRLNFCVRDGNRWNPQAIATAKGEHFHFGSSRFPVSTLTTAYEETSSINMNFSIRHLFSQIGLIKSTKSSYRPISIIKLHTLLHFHR